MEITKGYKIILLLLLLWILRIILDFKILNFFIQGFQSQMKKITTKGVKDSITKKLVIREVTTLNGVWSSEQSDLPMVRQIMYSLRSSP